MKLICTAGTYQNKEYDLDPPGISLGREMDNDVVLDDEKVSRYHAKIEYHDKTWYVHDMNSSNGVYLNGKKISETAPLAIQDEVRIGSSVFRFADAAGAHTPAPPAKPERPAEKKPTPAATDAGKGQAKLLRLVLVAVLTLLVVVIIVLATSPGHEAPAITRADPMAVAAEHPLEILYERLEVSDERIFRYHLEMTERELKVAVDDALNDTRIREELSLTEDQAEELRTVLLTTEWLEQQPPRHDPGADFQERSRLLVHAGPVGNYLVVSDAPLPGAVDNALSLLTDLVQRELGIFVEPIPREVAIARAQEFYLTAVRRHKEATIEPVNLYSAILAYRQVVERLKWIDNKPEWYGDAVNGLERAEETLNQKVAELRKEAVTYRHTGQYPMAKARLQKIIEMIPASNHPDVARARSEIMSIDREMRKQR